MPIPAITTPSDSTWASRSRRGSDREPDAELAPARADREREHAGHADDSDEQRDAGEAGEHERVQPFGRQHNQAILIAVDERPEQHLANDAEDGGVGADAQRQRDGDGGRKRTGVREGAQRDSDVLPERLGHAEPPGTPDVPHRLARQREVAELPHCSEAGLSGILA